MNNISIYGTLRYFHYLSYIKSYRMPRHIKIPQFLLFGIFFLAIMAFNPIAAQSNERTVKGEIIDEQGPVLGANIVLKDTRIGTVSDIDGKFTFPRPLRTGDVLIISYIGYKKQSIPIKDDTTFISLTLTEEMIEIIGALQVDKPYKSKRKKKN